MSRLDRTGHGWRADVEELSARARVVLANHCTPPRRGGRATYGPPPEHAAHSRCRARAVLDAGLDRRAGKSTRPPDDSVSRRHHHRALRSRAQAARTIGLPVFEQFSTGLPPGEFTPSCGRRERRMGHVRTERLRPGQKRSSSTGGRPTFKRPMTARRRAMRHGPYCRGCVREIGLRASGLRPKGGVLGSRGQSVRGVQNAKSYVVTAAQALAAAGRRAECFGLGFYFDHPDGARIALSRADPELVGVREREAVGEERSG